MPHTNPFAPDPRNPYAKFSSTELEGHRNTLDYCVKHLETYADGTRVEESRTRLDEATEELSRRGDVDQAVSLWERLCAVPFVRGETQGNYTHSTAHLSPVGPYGYPGNVHRMPDIAELEALVLSDGEETAYPVHDVEYTPPRSAMHVEHVAENPWSGDDRLYPITLTLISCGDYHGSDVDAANNRALAEEHPGVDVREPNTGGRGSVFNVSTVQVGAMTPFMNAQEGDGEREPAAWRADALEWLESLVNVLESLATDTVLLNEEKYSELIDELAVEAWESWMESETLENLIGMAPEDGTMKWADVLDDVPEKIREHVRRAYFDYDENEWTVSSLSEGATNGRHEDAVKHVARTVFGWDIL